MKSSTLISILALSFFTIVSANDFSYADFNQWFNGDGTYYGYTSGGNCAIREIPDMYKSLVPVAINNDQYYGSASCGACVEFEGEGVGSGANPIVGRKIGYVHDRCPECHHGSLDLSKSGDGRWQIRFRFIKCPFEENVLTFLFEGSNYWYWKIQPRGLQYPAKSLVINGLPTEPRTQDNFFIVRDPSGNLKPNVDVTVTDIRGNVFVAKLSEFKSDGVVIPDSVNGNGDSNDNGNGDGGEDNNNTGKCAANWRPCDQSNGCCSSDFKCKWHPKTGIDRCVRVFPQCFARGQLCTWYSGTPLKNPCCGGLSCNSVPNRPFKRCM